MSRPRAGVAIDTHCPESAWQARATCRRLTPDLFFSESVTDQKQAKLVCTSCPVRFECLEYALVFNERDGVWGGTGPIERRKLRKARRITAAA